MNEEEIRKGIEILQDTIKDNRVHSKQFIVGESELIATLNALHKAIDIEKELQQEKEKNKKLEEEKEAFVRSYSEAREDEANTFMNSYKQKQIYEKVIGMLIEDIVEYHIPADFCMQYGKYKENCKTLDDNQMCKECIKEYYFKKARGGE